jgi:hypothetical protein
MLCDDLDEVKCKEFGMTAALVLRTRWGWIDDFSSRICQLDKRRWVQIISNHFTEQEEKHGHNLIIDLSKAFIPFARPPHLEDLARTTSGLAAMREMLIESPDRCDNFDPGTQLTSFHNLDSPYERHLSQEVVRFIEKSNDQLWYQQKLSKRIAVGFEGSLRSEFHSMRTWHVVDIDDGGLLEKIQQQEDTRERSFREGLQSTQIPVKVVNVDDDDDDAATLVDIC